MRCDVETKKNYVGDETLSSVLSLSLTSKNVTTIKS
jgi:hypothetical protein